MVDVNDNFLPVCPADFTERMARVHGLPVWNRDLAPFDRGMANAVALKAD